MTTHGAISDDDDIYVYIIFVINNPHAHTYIYT